MKKTILRSAVLAIAGVGLMAGSAMAAPVVFGDGGTGLQAVLNNITTTGDSSVNVNTSQLSDTTDSVWNITASGGSVSTMVIEIAGLASTNTFGVYSGTDYVELFNGAASATLSSQVTLSILSTGTVRVNGTDIANVNFSSGTFGYYLDSRNDPNAYTGGLWHSDTAKNHDGEDHMVAYRGTGDNVQIAGFFAGEWTQNEYILAWEDLYGSYHDDTTFDYSDRDFTDMVVMVESVNPVPEPSTMLLFGAGLAGLAGVARRKKMRK